MCGRTACTLAPDDIQKACCYRNPQSKRYTKPQWREASNCGRSYRPSHNVCPTDITPVLLSGSHFDMSSSRILQPMMWGLIPPWHKGDYKCHGLSTNNCRLENLEKSKLYKQPFNKGQRCAVVCDGFYEWQTTKDKKSKQPYFIYVPQDDAIKIEEPTTWSVNFDEEKGWAGPKLLVMAALFDIWQSPEGDEIFSYSVITLESNSTLSWLHHRMPAILDSEEALSQWLDYGLVNSQKALQVIKTVEKLVWHPVSTAVNNSRNKDPGCNKPVDEKQSGTEKKVSKEANFMKSWLQRSGTKQKLEESEKEDSKCKILKTDSS